LFEGPRGSEGEGPIFADGKVGATEKRNKEGVIYPSLFWGGERRGTKKKKNRK